MTIEEALPEPANPLGVDGIEFIEYATPRPQALGALLQKHGLHAGRAPPLARGDALPPGRHEPDRERAPDAPERAARRRLAARRAARARRRLRLAALARPRRLGDADARRRRWSCNIPGIHGVGDSLIYFVDRYQDFSIYDVDFVPLPGTEPHPPALAGLHWFGIVQTILADRTDDWVEFYRQLFGFSVLPRGQYFGILPKGTLLESPCHKFYLQLIEPPPGAEDIEWDERLLRIGLGAPDVPRRPARSRERGVVFVDRDPVQPTEKGALTQVYLGGVTFELVVSHLRPEPGRA